VTHAPIGQVKPPTNQMLHNIIQVSGKHYVILTREVENLGRALVEDFASQSHYIIVDISYHVYTSRLTIHPLGRREMQNRGRKE